VDLKHFQNYHRSDSHKTIEEDLLEVEDSLGAEDSLEVEDSLEAEDFQEEVGTRAEVEHHPEDHPEEVGTTTGPYSPSPTRKVGRRTSHNL